MIRLLLILAIFGVCATSARADSPQQPAQPHQYFPKLEYSCPNGSQVSGSGFCAATSPHYYFIPESPNHTCPNGFVRAGSGYCRREVR